MLRISIRGGAILAERTENSTDNDIAGVTGVAKK
jgi:hypothetical protein